MITLPGGLRVWNSSPHDVLFHSQSGVIVCPPDGGIPITKDCVVVKRFLDRHDRDIARVSKSLYLGNDQGREVIRRAHEAGAHIIIGSRMTARAYPGEVVAPARIDIGGVRMAAVDRFETF